MDQDIDPKARRFCAKCGTALAALNKHLLCFCCHDKALSVRSFLFLPLHRRLHPHVQDR